MQCYEKGRVSRMLLGRPQLNKRFRGQSCWTGQRPFTHSPTTLTAGRTEQVHAVNSMTSCYCWSFSDRDSFPVYTLSIRTDSDYHCFNVTQLLTMSSQASLRCAAAVPDFHQYNNIMIIISSLSVFSHTVPHGEPVINVTPLFG